MSPGCCAIFSSFLDVKKNKMVCNLIPAEISESFEAIHTLISVIIMKEKTVCDPASPSTDGRADFTRVAVMVSRVAVIRGVEAIL